MHNNDPVTVTVTFTLPDSAAAADVLKALQADLAFMAARTTRPDLTIADYPHGHGHEPENVHQLALPMRPPVTRRCNQTKGYEPTNPAVRLFTQLYGDRLAKAAAGRSLVTNMVAVLDHLATVHGVAEFTDTATDIADAIGLSRPVTQNAVTALGNAGVIVRNGRKARIEWGLQ